MLFAVWIAAAVLVPIAVAVCALVVHTRRAQQQADVEPGPRYAPTSADPQGRWQISRHGEGLLEPTPYVLNTDHDGPAGTPLPPVAHERQAASLSESRIHSTTSRRKPRNDQR